MIDPSAKIHASSVIEDGAVIGAHCEIGPFCHIGPKVRLGTGVICYSHVAIMGDTEIGDGTKMWPHSSVGSHPQDLKYAGEDTKLVIGKRNMIRESTSISTGTVQGANVTIIGDDNLFMIGAHIGHDCVIGNNIVFANNAAISGHATIEDGAIIGGQAGVIQFARIGKGAMIGAGSMVAADVVPFGLTMAERPHLAGINYVGLKRRGVDKDGMRAIKAAVDEIFASTDGVRAHAEAMKNAGGHHEYVEQILDFLLADSSKSFMSPKADK